MKTWKKATMTMLTKTYTKLIVRCSGDTLWFGTFSLWKCLKYFIIFTCANRTYLCDGPNVKR